MTAPTSFQGEKPEAASLHRSEGLPENVHGGRAFNALESLVSLTLILLIVWLWIGRDDS